MQAFEKKYKEEVIPTLMKELGIANPMQAPRFEKVVLNMGIGTYIKNGGKDYQTLVNDMKLIAGQSPVVTKSRKAISNFKLREGMPVGIKVTLRGDRMYAFLDKLIQIVLPRVRDFRGVPSKAFDANGNYNLGITEHTIFPEVPQDDVVKPHGLQITIKTTTNDVGAARALLTKMGMPFKK